MPVLCRTEASSSLQTQEDKLSEALTQPPEPFFERPSRLR